MIGLAKETSKEEQVQMGSTSDVSFRLLADTHFVGRSYSSVLTVQLQLKRSLEL